MRSGPGGFLERGDASVPSIRLVRPLAEEVLLRAASALREAGLSDAELAAAVEAGADELARVVARHLTFPGRRALRPAEVWSAAGVDEATTRALWRAMGFPEVPDDAAAFTEHDVHALRTASALFERTGMDSASGLRQARAMSQATMRIAESHQDVIGSVLAADEPIGAAAEAVALAEVAMPALDELLVYMYRRHLAAATEQRLVAGGVGGSGERSASVGFADLAGFTRTSEALGVDGLATMIEHFNASTAGVIADGGGRVVKTIGDEVMFVGPDPAGAATIGLGLLDAVTTASGDLALRVGIATGPVLAREGDIFGRAVNLASRLVVSARPGSVLVDAATKEALDDRFATTALAPRRLSGIGSLRCWRIRRRSGSDG